MLKRFLGLCLISALTACQSVPSTNPPGNQTNPYAAFGCAEPPNPDPNKPRQIFDIRLSTAYEFQGGSYLLYFDIPNPIKVRVRLTGLETYDSLLVQVNDKVDTTTGASLYHNAGDASDEDGPALTQAVLETEDQLEVTVSVALNRSLSEYTLRNDDGKRLFCQQYTVVVETIP
jgi:hypothetical protein